MNRKTKWLLSVIVCAGLLAGVSLQQWTAATGDNKADETADTTNAAGDTTADSASKPAETSVQTGGSTGTELVAESGSLQLFMDMQTTEISVKDKRTGHIWYSNPVDRDKDTKAEGINRDNLSAQIGIVYNDQKGQTSYTNNYVESIKRNQFQIQKTDKGVKIIYQLGNFQKGIALIPMLISKQRMEEKILSKLPDDATRFEVEKRFFFDEEKQVYKRKDMPEYVIKDVVALLEQTGYTAEDAAQDNAENSAGEEKSAASPKFTIPLEYSLEDDALVVKIPTSEVQDSPEFPLESIRPLELFGAAGTNQNDGYMFVPDGSGALINLNNGKISAVSYEVPLYGKDKTLRDKEKSKQFMQLSRLPVFGMKQGDHAFFSIIENGDATASIKADISGSVSSYNFVRASFMMKPMEEFRYRAGSVSKDSPMFAPMMKSDIQLRYAFLSGDDASYVGMAQYYQKYLEAKGQLKKLEASDNTPFVLNVVGSIPVRETFLGIPYRATESLTSFEQAEQLLKMLKQRGINNIQLQYSGWFNGGINHNYPDDVDVDGVLGGDSGFEQLIQYAKDNQIGLYPDVAFNRVYRSGHGFRPSRDGTDFLYREEIAQFATDLVSTSRGDFEFYVMSPIKLPGLVDDFISEYKSWNVGGVSLRDMGEDLSSVVKSSGSMDRGQSKEQMAELTKKLAENAGKTMVSGGNAYTLPYTQMIVNAPLDSSKTNLADESVPFYEIVLHGYVDIAGTPINLSRDQDYKTRLLKNLETGTNTYYEWFYEAPESVRNTEFDYMYSAHYANWFDESVKFYEEADRVLKDVRHATIVGHEKLSDNVYRTTFSNGKTITVNYNREAAVVEGTRLEAQSYAVGGATQ